MEYAPNVHPAIMIIEDNPLIVEFVTTHLTRAQFTVVVAEGCHEALELLQKHTPELIIMDVVLDDGLGTELCHTIRAGGSAGALARLSDVPIMLLTARAEQDDRLKGFESGADDYITKPFDPEELLYRIRAILRRSTGISNALLDIGALQIDPRRRTVSVEEHTVVLTPKEFELLHLLASSPGRVFSRDDLLERIWGYSFPGNTRTVDVHVNRLRQKLVAQGLDEDIISTEWGVGYKLVAAKAALLALEAC